MKKLLFNKNTVLALFCIMLVISFVSLTVGSTLLGSGYPVDVTADKRFTLSKPTLNLLKDNRSDIFIRLYVSEGLENDYPSVGQYARYVSGFLEQYKLHADNRISLEIVTVRPYERSETDAKKQGIRGFLDVSGQHNLYFGAVFSNEAGDIYTIPYFEAGRQSYLEHDITRLLSKLSKPYMPKNIGIISPSLDISRHGDSLDYNADWPVIRMLRQDYTVDTLPAGNVSIPMKYDALLVVNPLSLTNLGLYALDQYLLRGGKIILFLDPFWESYLSIKKYITNPETPFPQFLANYGVGYTPWKIAGDVSQSRNTLIGSESDAKMLDYPIWLDLQPGSINPQHPVTGGINSIRLNSAGYFETGAVTSADVTPLLMTSSLGGSISADIAQYSSKATVRENYKTDNKSYRLAVLLEGRFPSFYKSSPLEGTSYAYRIPPYLSVSVKEGKLLLIGDADILHSGTWNNSDDFKGATPYDFVPFNGNAEFIERAVDFMSGNTALISLPGKRFLNSGQNMEELIAEKITVEYQAELSSYENGMQKARLEQEVLKRRIADKELFPSVAVIKQLEKLQRDYLSAQERLKALQYKISEQIKHEKYAIMLLNAVVWPGLLTLFLFLVTVIFRKQEAGRAAEYTHE